MAKNDLRRERLNKIRDKIEKKTSVNRKKVEVTKTEESSFMAESFPIIIIGIIIVVFLVFYFLFNTYKEVMKVDNDGFLLNTNTIKKNNKKTTLSIITTIPPLKDLITRVFLISLASITLTFLLSIPLAKTTLVRFILSLSTIINNIIKKE